MCNITEDTPRFLKSVFHIPNKSKEEGKDQESIQSGTTPDPGNHMGK